MSKIVIFDVALTPQKVLKVISGADTADFGSQVAGAFVPDSDVVVNPDLSALVAVPRRYWKHVSGSILEYTTGEKSTQDAAEAAAEDTNLRSGAKAQMDGLETHSLFMRAFADILREEINTLRTLHSLADRTLAQLKTAIKNRVDDGTVDNE